MDINMFNSIISDSKNLDNSENDPPISKRQKIDQEIYDLQSTSTSSFEIKNVDNEKDDDDDDDNGEINETNKNDKNQKIQTIDEDKNIESKKSKLNEDNIINKETEKIEINKTIQNISNDLSIVANHNEDPDPYKKINDIINRINAEVEVEEDNENNKEQNITEIHSINDEKEITKKQNDEEFTLTAENLKIENEIENSKIPEKEIIDCIDQKENNKQIISVENIEVNNKDSETTEKNVVIENIIDSQVEENDDMNKLVSERSNKNNKNIDKNEEEKLLNSSLIEHINVIENKESSETQVVNESNSNCKNDEIIDDKEISFISDEHQMEIEETEVEEEKESVAEEDLEINNDNNDDNDDDDVNDTATEETSNFVEMEGNFLKIVDSYTLNIENEDVEMEKNENFFKVNDTKVSETNENNIDIENKNENISEIENKDDNEMINEKIDMENKDEEKNNENILELSDELETVTEKKFDDIVVGIEKFNNETIEIDEEENENENLVDRIQEEMEDDNLVHRVEEGNKLTAEEHNNNQNLDNNLEPELMALSERQVDENETEPDPMEIDEDDEEEISEVIEIFDDDDDDDDDENEDNQDENNLSKNDENLISDADKIEKIQIENNENDDDNDDKNEDLIIIEDEDKDKNSTTIISDDMKGILFFGKECINAECHSKCKTFVKAPQFIINFFIMPHKTAKVQYVCEDCYEFSISKYENFCTALVSHKCILDEDIPKRHEVVEILDSSDEEDDPNDPDGTKPNNEREISEKVINFLDENLDDAIKTIMKRVDIVKQKKMMGEKFETSIKNIENDLELQSNVLRELQMNADQMYYNLYSSQKMNIQELQPLDLNSGRSYSMDSELSIPPQGELIFPSIIINQSYLAMKNRLIDNWLPCQVIEISDVTSSVKYFKVKFDNVTPLTTRYVTSKQIAYIDPPSVRLQIGTRVIGLFDSTTLNHGNRNNDVPKNAFFPGIVGEPLTTYNRFRYLIFFDDGYAQYVSHKNIRLVCDVSDNVWDDVHASSKEFFRSYLTQYQRNRPMVQAKKGQIITTESNGKWYPAKVIDIDASLVQMQFSGKNHIEWIYRGSTRLAPLFKERYTKKTTQISQLPRRTEPFVRYMQDEDTSFVEKSLPSNLNKNITGPSSSSSSSTAATETATEAGTSTTTTTTVRAVAKKSVTKNSISSVSSLQSQQQQQQQQQNHHQYQQQIPPQQPVKHLNNSTIFVDDDNRPKGKVVYYTAKKNMPPRQYQSHDCKPSCLFPVAYNLSSYSPLSKPLLSGWERLMYKYKQRKLIAYRAPCGRILRNMEEIHRYLRATKNVLNVDNFDFDPTINCLAEYVIERCIVQKADLSEGAENMIIPCINYYDNTMPPECTYSTKRIPTEGVFLNLDPEFLVGCDCTDDCSDKTKCSCWQLTLDGARFNNSNVPLDKIGYSYMRLPEPVPTGIYECNARCKCAKNCLNRVVQHPLQMKLQVFKTSNRGWGLRCINDIPKGSFICIYAGHLLTEQNANEGGAHFGDEYFAELDYIEVVERLKEGYESDVQEDIDSDDEPEEKNRGNDSDEEFRLHRKIQTKSPSVHTRMQARMEKAKSSNDDDDNNTTTNNNNNNNSENRRKVLNFEADTSLDNDVESTPKKYRSVRKYFGKDEYCYVMDAKLTGNIGRYFNHSCSPNLFVQNVFVDTHDLRFPWVAFFALQNIKAGTELTWNYNYEVGIVPGKVLYCECGSANCRGRLL